MEKDVVLKKYIELLQSLGSDSTRRNLSFREGSWTLCGTTKNDNQLSCSAEYTNDLISVAYFQLAVLMTTKGFKGVKFCSMCNKLFVIEHGSTKICNVCKREYHRIKTQESRMKKNK